MRIILPEIKELLGTKQQRIIRRVLSYFEPADIAEVWSDFTPEERLKLFNILDVKLAADIFEFLEEDQMIELLENLPARRKIAVLNEMSPDDRTDLFAALPAGEVEKIIPLLDLDEQNRARELLAYKANTAGGLMTTDYITVPETANIADALRELRTKGRDIDFIQNIYVVDKVHRLQGIIPLKNLLTATPRQRVERVMDGHFPSVGLEMDQEDVAHMFGKYDVISLPVLDKLGRIRGIITVDDVIDVIKEEASEDIYRFSASGVVDEYLSENPLIIARKRGMWLLVLALAGFVSGAVLEHYSFLLSSIVTLSFFIPILMNTSGSAGTQAATVVIRSLAIKRIRIDDIWKVVKKEFVVGILVGLVSGAVTALRAIILNQNPTLALTVMAAMAMTIVLATVLGGVLPLFFARVGLDPALMSGPLITTILDTATLIIYFNVAIFFYGVFE
ncbi:magnesium transporter [candidate division WOR-3 bacterium]|nr:magnesium transporter [candidate division WOR-3 bacterium]